MLPELASYHWIVINSSAGKDSQAMLEFVVEQVDQAGVPRVESLLLTRTSAESNGRERANSPKNRLATTA
jgi:hypothetical protein